MAHNDKSGPNESPPLPRLSYKINEAAKILGVSPITIRRAISRGVRWSSNGPPRSRAVSRSSDQAQAAADEGTRMRRRAADQRERPFGTIRAVLGRRWPWLVTVKRRLVNRAS